MKFFLLLFFTSALFAKSYYSKVEPYEMRTISSNVVGQVLYTNENKLGKVLDNKPFIKMDTKLHHLEVKAIDDKITYLRENVKSSEMIEKDLEATLKKREINYKKIKKLSTKSIVEKDREFYALITSKNGLYNAKEALNNLKIQITDLKYRKDALLKTIKDKTIRAKGLVLYSIDVQVGQVVGVGTPLAKVADISFAKLTFYLDREDVANAYNKTIYIDGKKSKYKISRLIDIADGKNISSYKAEVIIDAPKIFSNLVKIELKDE
jgi:galactitol-specific phosphotransferase system IIB component